MSWHKERTTTVAKALGAKRFIVVPLTSTVVGIVASLLLVWGEAGMRAFANWIPLLIGLLFAVAFLAYGFLEYANKLRLELKGITDLETCLDQLAVYLEEGNREILNATLKTTTDLPAWYEKNKQWQTKVEAFLEGKFGLRERNSFRHIVVLEYKLPDGLDKKHIQQRNILAWKLLTLKEIILRYNERSARWRAEGS
jgi:hypothetical protein